MRTSILSALQRIKCFGEEVSESVRRFGTVIQQIEGGYQVMQTDDNNSAVSDQVTPRLYRQWLKNVLYCATIDWAN